jgi:hypothetical protein
VDVSFRLPGLASGFPLRPRSGKLVWRISGSLAAWMSSRVAMQQGKPGFHQARSFRLS